MNTNYSNNYHQSFGSFNFSKEAKVLLKCRVKTSAKLAKLEKICNNENTGARAARNIDVNVISNLAGGPVLVADYKGASLYDEGFFDTVLSFLKKATKRANKCDAHNNSRVAKAIDKLV